MPRALLSVFDKTDITTLAHGLVQLGWELVSSGGTARALAEAGLPVTKVDEVTGSPEMLDGRVKTLHPRIHGGVLADRDVPGHLADLEREGISPIDLVVCNLYPFRSDPSVELIDIGGPTMVRAAAKNFAHVGIVVDPADYRLVLDELAADGHLGDATRRRLARAAFAHTAAYDAAIVRWLDQGVALPDTLHLALERVQDLRYGENPHQDGARYRADGERSWWDDAVQHGGKQLSYLNLYDAESAWRLVHELGDRPAAVVIKHANPCGAAVADTLPAAYQLAHEGDSTSAFGGIVAVNRTMDAATAGALAPIFTEVVVAPAYEDEALAALTAKKNLRVLTAPAPSPSPLHVRSLDGGLLVQDLDGITTDRSTWQVATERAPSDAEWVDLELAWILCARVTSNAIVLVKDGQAVGIGAGQQSRVDASRIAADKAAGRAVGGACASDAFFPFRDGIDAAAAAGATAVVQPGGSVRDDEVIAAANEHGIAMVLTGERHFRH
ncbi:MAG: bifunctional phosphoribosylaminoimidazolecarboxamide formyltransferase/IMP cyclohydrolase [Actinomycetota bacterium]